MEVAPLEEKQEAVVEAAPLEDAVHGHGKEIVYNIKQRIKTIP